MQQTETVYVVCYRWRGWTEGAYMRLSRRYATYEEAARALERISRKQNIAFSWKVEERPLIRVTTEPMEIAA